MDIGKSLTYYFDDPRWVNKILIGTGVLILSTFLLIFLVGVLGYLIVMGYALETLRNARKGEQYPMPEWKDRWGEWLVTGFKLFVAIFVWALPIIVFSLAMIVSAAMTDSRSEFAQVMGVFGMLCLGCLMFLWSVVLVIAQPAIYIRVAEKDSIGAALQFGSMLRFTRDHIGDVIIVSIVYVIASAVLQMLAGLGFLLLCVGIFVTVPLATLITYLIQAHLYAQVGMGRGTTLATADDTDVSPTPQAAPVMVTAPVVETETTAPAVQPDDQTPAPESE